MLLVPGMPIMLHIFLMLILQICHTAQIQKLGPEDYRTKAAGEPAPADGHSPLLAGDDSYLLALTVRCHKPSLPPLIIRGIDDMQDVPIGEAEPLTG